MKESINLILVLSFSIISYYDKKTNVFEGLFHTVNTLLNILLPCLNVDLLVQKKSEAGLIGYQDNTLTHINDLITEKAKGPKKFRYGFIWIHQK